MARQAKPWWRESHKSWYAKIRGKQVNLGKDKDEAHRLFHELLGRKDEDAPPPPAPSELTAEELFHEFLEWTERNRSANTFTWYQKNLNSFVKPVRDRIAAEVRPIDVIRWVDGQKTWSASSKRGAMIAVSRAFNWGVKTGLLDRNPVAHMEKPSPERREAYITEAEFKTILNHVRGEQFKDLLVFCWETGCRPQEARQLTAAMFEPDAFRFVLPAKQSKGKKRVRRIYLSPVAMEIAKRLTEKHSEGEIFRNTQNRPWTAYAVNCRFQRIQVAMGYAKLREQAIALPKKRADRERLAKSSAPKYCLYLSRHAFAQRKLEQGINHIVVAELLGHSDATMLSRVYQHMNQADRHLRDAISEG